MQKISNAEHPDGQPGPDAQAGSPEVAEAPEATGATEPGPRGTGRAVRAVAYVTAAALALGVGFGLTRLIAPPRAAAPSSVIPSPAKTGGVFTEDDDETGQDTQTNIFSSTVPGLMHIMSGGKAVGVGLALTPSGKVLTTYRPAGGTGGLSAKYVRSGQTFEATVLGTDAAAGLALLQLEGGHGRAFSTVAVGNSDTLVANANASNQLSYHLPGEVFDTAVGTTGTRDAVVLNTGVLIALNQSVTVNGKAATGLLQSRLQTVPVSEIGGPLVNLNGQVIGVTLTGDGSGLKVNGYAMPINQVLAIARQIDVKARHTS